MPGDELLSPRDAIRNWLQDTSPNPRKTAISIDPVRNKDRSRSDRTLRVPDREYTRRTTNPVIDRRSRQHDKHAKHTSTLTHVTDKSCAERKDQISSGQGGFSLAERLGLHEPFRAFKDHSDEDISPDGTSQPRKRRRTEPLASSLLDDAEIEYLAVHKAGGGDLCGKLDFTGKARKQTGTGPRLPSRGSPESTIPSPPIDKPIESYERKPRRKTREDRYEIKPDDDQRRKKGSSKREKGGRKHKSRKRKEKSGAALMHDFAAQNISHDRLTLQPQKPLGFFGKGRASSPIRRRGLPDLTFSEMNFLNSRRAKPEGTALTSNHRASDRSRRKKSAKAADAEAEISRYFTSSRVADQTSDNHQHQPKRQDRSHKERNHDLPLVIVDLPEKPFLGFGSCGVNPVSPVKSLSSPTLNILERRLSRSSSSSSSYLTWSQSGTLSQATPHREKHTFKPLDSSGPATYTASPPRFKGTNSPNSVDSSSFIAETSVEQRESTRTLAPERSGTAKSGQDIDCSSHTKVKQTGGTAASGKRQEEKKVECNDKHETQRAKESSVPKESASESTDQHYNREKPIRGHVTQDHAEKVQRRTILSSQPLKDGDQNTASPLDHALEALLQESKPNRTSETMKPFVRQPMPHDGRRNNPPVDRCIDDHGQDHSSVAVSPLHDLNSSSGFPIVATLARTCAANANAKPDHALQGQQVVSGRSDSSSLRQREHIPQHMKFDVPDLHRHPEDNRANSRNAWTEYKNVYEQQNHVEHHAFASDGANYHRTLPDYENFGGALSLGYHDHRSSYYDEEDTQQRVSRFNAEGHPWPNNEEHIQYEAPDRHCDWRDMDETLLASYETNDDISDFPQGIQFGQQECQVPMEPQEHLDPMLQTYVDQTCPVVQHAPAREFHRHENSNHSVAASGFAIWSDTENLVHSPDDAALSRFWTPHKLY